MGIFGAPRGRGGTALVEAPTGPASRFVEGALLRQSLSSLPSLLLSTLVLAGLPLVLRHAPNDLDVVDALVAAVTVLGATALGLGRLLARRTRAPEAARRGRWIATALLALLGTAFGGEVLAALLGSDASNGVVLFAIMTSAVAGAWLCGPAAAFGQAFLGPVAVLGTIGLARLGGTNAILSIPLLLTAAALAVGLRQRERLATTSATDRLSRKQKAETIDALLLHDGDELGWMWETDAAGRLRNVGEGLARAVGQPVFVVEGTPFKTIYAPRQSAHVVDEEGAGNVKAAMQGRRPFREVLVEIEAGATTMWWRLSGMPLTDESGTFLGYRGFGADVTGARELETRLAYLANHDSLTGLANRTRFQAEIARECRRAEHDGRWRALLFLDLDGFKTINDSLGHASGDEVLREIAHRLEAVAPAHALVARLGGDEFGIFCATTPAHAEQLASDLLESIGRSLDLDGVNVTLAASIGIAYTPKHTISPDDLLGKADLALYRAKAEGKGRVRTFAESDEAAVVEKRKLDADLRLALARGEFELVYQPLIDVGHGHVVAFEALIRWRSPTRGLVLPGSFIPAAEASGLIASIGRWALFEACREAARWPNDIRIAVNVSPRQFADADFPASVAMALRASGLRPPRLEIEITEGVFLDQTAIALSHLKALRERGVRIALDDFGTGYSSLSYLTRFPVDKIKIDRSFVQSLGRFEDLAIVEAILALARALSIEVTAEGVETAEQALALRVRRCNDIQGYFLSKPRPASEVPAMIREASAALAAVVPLGGDSPLALALAMRRLPA